MGAAIFIHPWDMLGKDRMDKYWLPWLVGMPTETAIALCSLIFGGVLERLPRLKVGFAHGGGISLFLVLRPHLFLSLSFSLFPRLPPLTFPSSPHLLTLY